MKDFNRVTHNRLQLEQCLVSDINNFLSNFISNLALTHLASTTLNVAALILKLSDYDYK